MSRGFVDILKDDAPAAAGDAVIVGNAWEHAHFRGGDMYGSYNGGSGVSSTLTKQAAVDNQLNKRCRQILHIARLTLFHCTSSLSSQSTLSPPPQSSLYRDADEIKERLQVLSLPNTPPHSTCLAQPQSHHSLQALACANHVCLTWLKITGGSHFLNLVLSAVLIW